MRETKKKRESMPDGAGRIQLKVISYLRLSSGGISLIG